MSKEMRIAKIIDTASVVINAGEDNGIKKGDKFQIIGKKGVEVLDPETGESLGTLDDLKATVIASEIYPHMTIANSEMHEIPGIGSSEMFNAESFQNALGTSQMDIFKKRYVHDRLNVDKSQITGSFKKSNKPIQIGDLVVKEN
ncbi:FlgT C-terminal domain-containing protein [Companilactobacillus futsaii]|uniref:FlgT C-terminal domain-containing protein n=1 Tax=Companilactobacillus futsaii TaxID=938155 RepID=UPI00138ECDE4|nr:FlgT C-terminal domain-containing protein [Companilactobacillus futsaii]